MSDRWNTWVMIKIGEQKEMLVSLDLFLLLKNDLNDKRRQAN